MLRNTTAAAAVALTLLAGVTAPAFAADSGFYAGVTVGQSRFHQEKGEVDDIVVDAFNSNGAIVLSGTSSLDKTDTAFNGLVGYRFFTNFAVEAAYVDLGELKYHSTGTVTNGFATAPATANLTAEAKGAMVTALGILPLSPQFDLYARGGVFIPTVKLHATVSIGNVSDSASDDDDSADPVAGIGAAFHLNDRFTLRAEYTRFFKVGDEDTTGEADVDFFGVGAVVTF
jgi:OOP family OmpA-OmpF porin